MWLCEHLCWLLVLGLSAVQCKTIYLELSEPSHDEISFMKRYGYLGELGEPGSVEEGYSAQALSEGLSRIQAFAGLPLTGVLDAATKQLFGKKRCGVKDIYRTRRYVVQQGWDIRNITYRVVNGSSSLAHSRVEGLVARALGVWAPHGGLAFSQVRAGKADIMVSFAAGDHGDGFSFDGPGHVVAHAFPPPHGALHFDDDELWGADLSSEEEDEDITDFFAVAVHEIGHALGMSHSDVPDSVMFPYYSPGVEALHTDDILGMQALYIQSQPNGVVETTSPGAPRFTKADSDEITEEDQEEEEEAEEENEEDKDEENFYPDLCMGNYDTLAVIQGKIYVFEEEWVWVLQDRNMVEAGPPRRFHDVFLGLPPAVDVVKAVYEKANGNVVIFKERDFWEFDPSFRFMNRGTISKYYSIPSQVRELTTVFISNYNNKTYLIDEERFWRYDESVHKMDRGYPKSMSAWRNIPYYVDAAIIWKGDTFFFKGPRFWRFDNTLVAAHNNYPLPVAQIWFNCEENEEMNQYTYNVGP